MVALGKAKKMWVESSLIVLAFFIPGRDIQENMVEVTTNGQYLVKEEPKKGFYFVRCVKPTHPKKTIIDTRVLFFSIK